MRHWQGDLVPADHSRPFGGPPRGQIQELARAAWRVKGGEGIAWFARHAPRVTFLGSHFKLHAPPCAETSLICQ